jgi:hypothetical protein
MVLKSSIEARAWDSARSRRGPGSTYSVRAHEGQHGSEARSSPAYLPLESGIPRDSKPDPRPIDIFARRTDRLQQVITQNIQQWHRYA